MRVRVDAELPAGTAIELQTFVANAESPTPTEANWISSPSLDMLLPQFETPGMAELQAYRYLWLRVRMKSKNFRANPRLLQVRAETPSEDYMDHLPSVYRRKDDGILRRWLAMFRAELGDLERKLEEMPRHFNSATAPAEELGWLASWLAFEPPARFSSDEIRELLGRVIALHRRRGTLFGVREWVQLYTGVRPLIVESFRERRIWQLDYSSLLGFDTGLAPLAPQGMVLPDSEVLCNPDEDLPMSTGCGGPDQFVIGAAVVGESGPLTTADLGAPLFSETAHHFSVWIPPGGKSRVARRDIIRRTLEAEKPAYTDYDLCIPEPRMRVGLQSSIGIDAYVAGPPEPMDLTGAVLGLNSYLGDEPGEAGVSRVGRRALLGTESILE